MGEPVQLRADPGKRTLAELAIGAPTGTAAAADPSGERADVGGQVQRRAAGAEHAAPSVHEAAAQGIATPSSPLPYASTLARAFGRHDVSSIQAHQGPEAAASARAIGAQAYATGDHVVLGANADLHTVAHEAAHVVQQRGGVQLKGGVGAAGDVYERHADAVADRVVAGESAEDLLDVHAGRSHAAAASAAGAAIQRKAPGDDAALLDQQASLKNTDVEIPALEGALLSTRKTALELGLLSPAAFEAGLQLTRAMAQLQPAVAAKGAVDPLARELAALAAQQLYVALHHETSDDKNFRVVQGAMGGGLDRENPYTGETRFTTSYVVGATTRSYAGPAERLPLHLRQGRWAEAFASYRALIAGLDQWVADQLRQRGKGTPEEALGAAHAHHAQLRGGLEQIAGKHARRLPALFHPDAATVAKERAAGRPAVETVPMNVYVWKDAQDGRYHLYDLTTPSRPHEQALDAPPTAAILARFFEEVARYPEGEVRFTLPDGGAGVAATTGKTKWYEWVGYVGLAIAAVGLGVLTAGASVPATVCFATGAIAGGISAAGHLVDTARLGTATTSTVVLDVAQIVASFASVGAMGIAVRAGGAAAALSGSRWFVPLVAGAASADVVQLVALTDVTLVELTKIQNGAGSPDDKQRAMTVLLTQLVVMGGLTALSVQGARGARSLVGQPLEVVEQNGVKQLRVVGEGATEVALPRDAEAPVTGPPSVLHPEPNAPVRAHDMPEPESHDAGGTHNATSDIRWQMELKNKKANARGEAPRYGSLDSAVRQGVEDLTAAQARGYPYGFKDKASFKAFGVALKEGVAGKPTPVGGIPVPAENAAIQGSAVYHARPGDIDVALLVDEGQFHRLIEQSFAPTIAKVRARGVDPLRMTRGDATTAAERTLANAVEKGIIKRDDLVPRLSSVRDRLEEISGSHVDLSVVKRGGQFDRGPYFPIQ